ncbi:ATP-dependent helicase [Bradyrhizobium sp. BTAi1]|uniref:ATP-binding domain-containing protein n=1 Tax=Bradyrhizobium sp. (strain BTAi1 / ATCC BAA-1182) TaxID=288000 RepID=UPI0002E05C75|nr:ATP-dependent helicase [Bradyrhizobium sp. BTAi1]
MTFDFFEGAAGTGKTHNLVSRAGEFANDGVLGDGHKLLALTFMNGARRRLDARLGDNSAFRRRFDCQTFDVFARMLTARRRSLITPEMQEQANFLNEFDGPCALAAALLEQEAVRRWVARRFPLVLVDEAQDLDEHRMRILQGLSWSCRIVAAADAFQCLHKGRDTAPLMGWLEGAGETHRLTQVRRTTQQGLLAAALAVREGRDVRAVLTARTAQSGTSWSGAGFRLVEASIKNNNSGLLAWVIANDINQRQGSVVILTPDSNNQVIRAALQTVQTKQQIYKKSGVTFGPYPHTWDRHDDEEVDALLADIVLPETASCADLRALLRPLTEHASVAQAISRMDRLRRVHGHAVFTAAQVTEFVRESVRSRSRLGFRQHRGHLAMTIQRAKNREFPNVIVLWPHTAAGSSDHLRRLLYNAITRAQVHCTVIVLGQGRLNRAPFAP